MSRVFLVLSICLISFNLRSQSIFDLRKEDFNEEIVLDGTWDFFWQELIGEDSVTYRNSIPVQVPHDWATNDFQQFPKKGYGTYHARLLLPKENKELAIYVQHAFSAYKIIANGNVIYESGKVAKTEEDYRAYRLPGARQLMVDSDTVDVFIQVSNFGHNNAGLYYSVSIGDFKELNNKISGRQYINMFLAGGLFLTGVILLAFSFTFRQLENAIPFYALFSLSLMYRMLGAEPYPLHVIFPEIPYFLTVHLEYLSIHTAALFGGMFIFHLFPRQTIRWVKLLFYVLSLISMVVVIFTPPIVFTATLKYYLFIVLAYVVVFTHTIVKAKMEKEPTSGYLITALGIVFMWTLFQVFTFLGIGSVPYVLNVVLVSLIVVFCNLALFRTFMNRINMVRLAEAEIGFEKHKNTMLSLISHEIKMPVATLQMNMEMLKASKNKPEKFDKIKDKMIDLSYTAVDSIKKMLHDFIYFMSTKQELSDEMNVSGFCEYLKDNWNLKTHCLNHLSFEPSFLTDKLTIKYVINTLVNNAQKYSTPTDKNPEFYIEQRVDSVKLELRDYGIGISADQLDLMGKPQAKLNDNQEVSGMGFYLAKDLIERLGHTIKINSRGKEGTSVFIEFQTL